MNKVTVKLDKNFTTIPNEIIRNKEMSCNAKAILITMLSLPPDWDFTISGLSVVIKESREVIAKAIRELESFGYVERERVRKPNGTYGGTNYTVYQFPEEKQPKSENPVLDNPMQENPSELNNSLYIDSNIRHNKDINKRHETKKNQQSKEKNSKGTLKSNFRRKLDLEKLSPEERQLELSKMPQRAYDISVGMGNDDVVSSNVKDFFEYFLEVFSETQEKPHPILQDMTIKRIIKSITSWYDDDFGNEIWSVVSDCPEHRQSIDEYFKIKFTGNVNYNMPHFASKNVIINIQKHLGQWDRKSM
jgi:predicted transcriptional regulator